MIKINLTSTKETFQIGVKDFVADFSDTQLRKYFKSGQEVAELDQKIAEEYPNMENENDFGKLASAIADVLPVRAQSFQDFFDVTFGEGKGQEIYEICGESTLNMQKVFEAVWKEIVDKMQHGESEGQKTANKYIKNDNSKF